MPLTAQEIEQAVKAVFDSRLKNTYAIQEVEQAVQAVLNSQRSVMFLRHELRENPGFAAELTSRLVVPVLEHLANEVD